MFVCSCVCLCTRKIFSWTSSTQVDARERYLYPCGCSNVCDSFREPSISARFDKVKRVRPAKFAKFARSFQDRRLCGRIRIWAAALWILSRSWPVTFSTTSVFQSWDHRSTIWWHNGETHETYLTLGPSAVATLFGGRNTTRWVSPRLEIY